VEIADQVRYSEVMDPNDRLRSWKPRILFLCVLAILVLVGVIQYQWFGRSAAVEIEGTIRGLEAGIRQAVSREFQRYAPLVTDLEGLRRRDDLTPVETRNFLDRLWLLYGPEGTVPDLLLSVAYVVPGESTLYRLSRDQNWTRQAFPSDEAWSKDNQETNGFVVFRPSEKNTGPVLLLGLDVDGFFSRYILPSLAELYPGSQLSWASNQRDPPPREGSFNSQAYSFSPLSALFTGASLPRTLEVGIPKLVDLPWKGSRPPLRILSSWSVKLTLPADAPVLGVERRLAWNWLGSTLLLVVLAGAFGLILRQSARMTDLRRREKEFVASVSHELRTPLTVIRSAADNFSKGIVSNEKQVRYGQLILDQSLRLGRMIEEMLEFAQAETVPSQAPVQAYLIFESWLTELRPSLESLAAERQVQLIWDIAGVPASGRTNPSALRLILENLVVNALNHAYPASPGGELRTVRVTLKYLVPQRLELIVDDDGRGISSKEVKKVFEPFYRDQVSRDNQERGSGLGLFLAQRQARRMGGELRLESPWRRLDGTKKPGCRFTATVPFLAEGESNHGG